MNYATIVLVHRILVTLFLLHYLWKAFLLLSNKQVALQGYTSKTRVAEMVVSFLFLATGGWLMVNGASLTTLQWLKLAMVLGSIPIAIVGFKRNNKGLAVLAVLLILGAYGLAEINKKKTHQVVAAGETGKALYQSNCARCHGEAGDAQLAGAANLHTSQLPADIVREVILHGKGAMQPVEGLSAAQVDSIAGYVISLR
ncbi:MAG: cytochrome c [Chitinophagales bacterium]